MIPTRTQCPGSSDIETLLETSGMPPDLRTLILEKLGEDPEHALTAIARYCAAQSTRIRRQRRIITSKDRLLELEREAGTRDNLTGTYNKGKFNVDLETAVRQGNPFLLAYIDVRDFKKVNDHYGHPVGDRALQAIAKTLLNVTRASTGVYRPGGDEFTVIEQGKEISIDIARAIEERLIRAGEKVLVRAGENVIPVAYDIGAVHYGGNCSPDLQIREIRAKLEACADTAMYHAKIGAKEGRTITPQAVTLDPRKPLEAYAEELRILKTPCRRTHETTPNYVHKALALLSHAAAYVAGIIGAVGQVSYTQR